MGSFADIHGSFANVQGSFANIQGSFARPRRRHKAVVVGTQSLSFSLSLSLEEKLCFLMEIHGIFAEKCCGRNAISLSLFLSLSLSERAIMLLDANTRHFCGKMLW